MVAAALGQKARSIMSKKASTHRLTVNRETLRTLATAKLAEVVGGYASHACDNQSVGFLCGDLCGGSKSCQR
jgi:hypothetical protein